LDFLKFFAVTKSLAVPDGFPVFLKTDLGET